MQDKLSLAIRNAAAVVIQMSLNDQFVEAFRAVVARNSPWTPPAHQREAVTCVGCLNLAAEVKIDRRCAHDDCSLCLCRPFWCLDCLARWFASRQDPVHPEAWLDGKAACPTCRAVFCPANVVPLAVQ